MNLVGDFRCLIGIPCGTAIKDLVQILQHPCRIHEFGLRDVKRTSP